MLLSGPVELIFFDLEKKQIITLSEDDEENGKTTFGAEEENCFFKTADLTRFSRPTSSRSKILRPCPAD